MEFLKYCIENIPWYGIVLILALVVLAIKAIVRFTGWVKFKDFSWSNKNPDETQLEQRISDLEKMVVELKITTQTLKKEKRESQLDIRIRNEFDTLRDVARNRSLMFTENIVEMYTKSFRVAIDEECPELSESMRTKEVRYYAGGVRTTQRDTVVTHMMRLVFDNNFKELPNEDTPANMARKMIDEFNDDNHRRCSYLLRISMDAMRPEWDAPFSRDIFEKKYIRELTESALNEGNEFYTDVVYHRDSAFRNMHTEYGDLFHSFGSFKKFVEKRYKELY